MKKIIRKRDAILFSVLIGLFLAPIMFNLSSPSDLNSIGDDLDENNTDVFKLPKTSATDIDIITPENKMYTAPMNGYYPATYGFENDPTGSGVTPSGWHHWQPSQYGVYEDIGGHKKVYGMYKKDWLERRSIQTFTAGGQPTGTVEFYMRSDDANQYANYELYYKFGPPTYSWPLFITIREGEIRVHNGTQHTILTGAESDRWYHVRIDFRMTGAAPYLGLAEDTMRVYLDSVDKGTFGCRGAYPSVRQIHMKNCLSSRGITCYIDALGYSWDPNYNIGDNKEEGLLLSFNSEITLDWMGYSLDGQATRTILGDTTFPMPVEGPHTIQVFGEDPLGTIYQSDVRYFSIQDDDETPPEVSNLVITHDIHNVNISFDAIDQSGISKIEILVNGELIEPINQFQKNNNYLFMLSNKWILKNEFYEVEIRITDADDDRPNDSLTTTITGTFEITLENMYKYVDWQIESLKSYVDENVYWILSRLIINKLTMAQKHLTKAYELIENDRIPCGLVHDAKAKTLINIAESRTELFNKLSFIEDEVANYIINSTHEIRNNVVILMGASVGTEQSYQIALIEIKLLNLQDLIEDEISSWHRIGLNNLIGGAAAKLEMAISKLSLDNNIESTLISAQFKLELAKNKIHNLLNHGKISHDLAETLITKINQIKSEIEIVKNFS